MGDSYRPSRRPDRTSARPSLQGRITFTAGGGDSYRPNDARNENKTGGQSRGHENFTFSAGGPTPSFPPAGPAADSRPARRNRRGRGWNGSSQGNQRDSDRNTHPTLQSGGRRNQNGFSRGGRRAPYRKQAPHERPLLQSRDDTGSEHILGVTNGPNKFLNLDDLSEEEADMELDTDNASGESAASDPEANHKSARHESSTRADGNSVPKWSNPDPYTVLPPPDETTGKKRDVVKLIRKAKNQASEKATSSNAVAANDDFISFGFDDEEEEEEEVNDEPRWAPSQHNDHSLRGSLNDLAQPGPASITNNQYAQHAPDARGLPARPGSPQPQQMGPKSHKRKRGEHEGGILQEWLAGSHINPTPWVTDYEHLRVDMLKWLHNEIMDFYDYVRPDVHERSVRCNLITRIEAALGTRHFPQSVGHVLCFGSFPAGLYLPTADMDLVFATDRLRNGGLPALNLDAKSQVSKELWKAARKLENKRVAVDMTVIGRAKVPIIKFVDRMTGIKVDLSFENLTGVEAQETYQKWTGAFPDMVYLVALVKQFLAMRGLNDVHLGGLGGFSIICLVVSFIQLQPKPDNLGELFLNFLDYYGNKFNLAKKRIVMDPPQLANKAKVGIDGRAEKPDGLSIQDPNRPENNISGGSHKVRQIFQAFAHAHKTLRERVELLGAGMAGTSALEAVLGGNYESYENHRDHILNVKTVRPCPWYLVG